MSLLHILNFVSVVSLKADASDAANLKLAGMLGRIPIPFPLEPENACGNWGLQCPLVSGNKYTLKVELPIQSSYPEMNVGVRMQLLGDDKKAIICTKFPAQIKKS
jgi:hypothetical protein